MMLNKDPQNKELAVFGAALAGFFGIAGLLARSEAGPGGLSSGLWAAGAAITALYAALPPVRRPIFIGWSYLTYPLGWIVSHAVLLVVFWTVITPIGLLVRLFRHDALSRSFDDSLATYWSQRENSAELRRYFQQS